MAALTFVLLTTNTGYASAATFEKLLMPGPLSAAHAEFENDCGSCHDPLGESTQAELCSSCHENVAADIAAGSGFHGRHPDIAETQCQTCHREHQGAAAATLSFPLEDFDHHHTDFVLSGGHVDLDCTQCHEPSQPYHAAPGECSSCHAKDDVHQGALGQQCDSCHLSSTWQKPVFDHDSTSFPLSGAHAFATCASCHADQLFAGTATECAACHQQDDVHKGVFGENCAGCHDTSAWVNAEFDHGTTGFFLRGAHAGLSCAACHADSTQQSPGTSCVSCHRQDDPHNGERGENCAGCHSETTWQASFDHAQKTGFALLGAHAALACKTCHTDGLEKQLPTLCHDCHTPDPHAGQLGTSCEQCHNNRSFTADLRFDHHLTTFPLLGKHTLLACDDCHMGLRFHDADADCGSCHAADNPHGDRMSADCAACHNPVDWRLTRFDHSTQTSFSLSGAHADLSCASCHDHPIMLRASAEQQCSQCHQQDDPHDGQFGRNCGQCHSTTAFKNVTGFEP